jgi:glycine/D-amino acid oxidase-like deaminating enzyme
LQLLLKKNLLKLGIQNLFIYCHLKFLTALKTIYPYTTLFRSESQALRARLEQETPELLAHGIHLIAVQSGDGSLVVGDSHVYAPTPGPFGLQAVDDLILRELDAVADLPGRTVSERWMGVYASAPDRLMLVDRPAERVRLVIVTSGTGASTAFGIAEEVIDELL